MPNWAMNELFVQAPDNNELNKFIDKMKSACNDDEVLSFQSIRPMPEVLEDTISPPMKIEKVLRDIKQLTGQDFSIEDFEAKFPINSNNGYIFDHIKQYRQNKLAEEETGYSNWYEWQHDKWGVKWGASESLVEEKSTTTCVYTFQTPWGTPINWLNYLAKQYPAFNFIHKCADPSMDFHNEYFFENGELLEEINMSFEEALENGNWGGFENWEEMCEEEK